MALIADVTTFLVPPRWIFVRLTTTDGEVGWGEAIIPKRVRAVVGAIEDMTLNLKKLDFIAHRRCLSTIEAGSVLSRRPDPCDRGRCDRSSALGYQRKAPQPAGA